MTSCHFPLVAAVMLENQLRDDVYVYVYVERSIDRCFVSVTYAHAYIFMVHLHLMLDGVRLNM
jgi:hypothetical protein